MYNFFDFRNKNQYWVWLAIDKKTREIVGCYIGDRSRQSAKKLWASLPPVYRQCTIAYTDFLEAYNTVIPGKRHRSVYKDSGETNHTGQTRLIFENLMGQGVAL